MEIYQGYRDASMEKPAAEALARGHHVGFIAASDHLSTDASFSCVWAEKSTRESIFRAMQARRTYAATSKIILKVEILKINYIPFVAISCLNLKSCNTFIKAMKAS